MKVTKQCINCGDNFQADTRELNRGNARFCSRNCSTSSSNQKRQQINYTCEYCEVSFLAMNKAKFCSDSCSQKAYRAKQRIRGINIKYIQRSLQHLSCCICGWQEATRDIHHIIPVSKGGTNDMSNLVVLCPNHHRMAHSNLISEDVLKDANIRTISSPSKEGQDAVGSP